MISLAASISCDMAITKDISDDGNESFSWKARYHTATLNSKLFKPDGFDGFIECERNLAETLSTWFSIE